MLKQRGLSLVELMISITLGLILMTGVIQMFVGSKKTFFSQQSMSRVQETGRLAIEYISRDVRMAGFMGCPTRSQLGGVSITSTLNSPTSFRWDYLAGIRGYKFASVSDSMYVTLSGLSSPNGDPITPLLNTDVIHIVGASGNSTAITANKESTHFITELTEEVSGGCSAGNRFNGLCEGDILVATDCVAAKVVQATSISKSGSDIEIYHGNPSGAAPGNSSTSWGGAASTEYSFDPGAELIQMQKIVYYIKNNAGGQPALWQWVNGTNTELFEGVERLYVTYGLDTDSDNVPDTYADVATVGSNWAQVKSVRIEILVRSPDELLPEVQHYSFPLGTNPVPAGDKRLRQVFTATVGIRSRLE